MYNNIKKIKTQTHWKLGDNDLKFILAAEITVNTY